MFDLFLPYFVGLAMGIEPASAPQMVEEVAVATQEVLPVIDQGSGDGDVDTREPEAQIPTGKYTTAVEVRPILGMTKSNWVAVRLYEGQDLLYFSHLIAWRCGLWDIRYGINGAPADQVYAMEPCHDELGAPNSMTDVANFLPFLAFPPETIDSVYVEITFDDGTTDFAQFNRNEVLIP